MRKPLAALLALGIVALVAVLALRERGAGELPPASPGSERSAASASTELVPPAQTSGDADRSARVPAQPAAAEQASAPPPGGSTRVRVLDALDGSPIPNARVASPQAPLDAETDAHGWCTLAGLPERLDELELRIDASGYERRRATYSWADEHTVQLAPTTTLVGRVLDGADRSPLVGAVVSYRNVYHDDGEPREVVTGEGGYRLEVAVGQPLVLAVSAAGFPTDAVTLELRERAERVEHDVVLRRGVRVAGRVVDFETGMAIALARISDRGRTGAELTVAGDDGRFEVPMLPSAYEGALSFVVDAASFCALVVSLDPSELATGPPLVLRLVRGARVEGVVRDRTGAPVAGARVDVDAEAYWWMRPRAPGAPLPHWLGALPDGWRIESEDRATATVTDAEGRFRSRAHVPGAPELVVSVHHEAFEPLQHHVEQRLGDPGSTTWVELELAPRIASGSVSGRLALNGRPAFGTVTWEGATRRGRALAFHGGAYRLEKVEAGHVTLRAQIAGAQLGQSLVEQTATVELAAGAALVQDFDGAIAEATISGRVLFDDGAPAPNVRVGVASRAAAIVYPTTDDGGHWSATVPDVGARFFVSVSHGPLSVSLSDVLAGTSGVDLVLPRLGELVYRVVDARTKEPVERFELYWRMHGGGAFEESRDRFAGRAPDAEGWLHAPFPAGSLDVVVRATRLGYVSLAAPAIPIRADASTLRTFELEPGLDVTFAWAAGDAPEVALDLVPERAAEDQLPLWGGSDLRAYFGSDGRAELRGLAPGTYRVASSLENVVIEPATVELRAGMDLPIVLRGSER